MSEPHAQWKFWGKDHRADWGTFIYGDNLTTLSHFQQNNKTKQNKTKLSLKVFWLLAKILIFLYQTLLSEERIWKYSTYVKEWIIALKQTNNGAWILENEMLRLIYAGRPNAN